jgi:hypothetical protein
MFANPAPLIYGTITVGALLDAESARAETYAETVGAVVIAMLLVWLAHSYAQLMGRRLKGGERLAFRAAREMAVHELSILTGAAVPLVAVLIAWLAGATLGWAVTAAIWTAAAMIVVIEVVAGLRAELSRGVFMIQTVFGVLLGLLIIALKLVLH